MNWKKQKFYNHHLHTHYSVGDCVTKPEELVEALHQRGHKYITVTEHGTLASTYELWKECGKRDITPILGNEAYFVDDYEEESSKISWNYGHIIILCMNEIGWRNLKKLHCISWEKGYKIKPRIQLKDLCKYNEGLIITTGCMRGPVGYDYLGNDKHYGKTMKLPERKERIYTRIAKLKKAFGDRFYAEIQLLELDDQKKVNKFVLHVAKKFKLPIIVTGDCHYLCKGDTDIHDAMLCIARKEKLNDAENSVYPTNQLWLKTAEELRTSWKEWYSELFSEQKLARYIRNTVKLAKRVERYPIRPEQSSLPPFSNNPKKLVNEICWEHREANNILDQDEYWDRYQYELGIIEELGYLNYFLVVWDLALFARANDIPYNARGSVCGSLIAYLMSITWIDPIKFDLPFERFLTTDRISLPDIDMDFSSNRRDEVIVYAEHKYGKECVVHICNYLRFKPKQIFKDVGRILGHDFQMLNNITSKVEDNISEWSEFTKVAAVHNFLQDNEDIQPLAERMVGLIRQQGIHASGVVVTPGPCVDWLPVAYRTDNSNEQKKLKVVTEWDMYALEDLDILKLDFLGVNQLDIVAQTIELIKKRHKVKFKNLDDLYAILLADNCSDPAVYKLIKDQKTVGTFQLGTSDGMRTLGSDLKPENIHEIIAMISLYRTAVLEEGMHTQYVKRKYGEPFEYLHPKMEDVLKDTHGVMLYQEQMMAMGVVLAGFTRNDADHFRKGIKLKDIKKVRVWKDKFINGCKEYNGIKKNTALKIWDFMEAFAGYGFNKSHAASYGVLAYMTAWLKINYTAEYMASLLSCNATDDKKLYKYILDLKKQKIKLFTPYINLSQDTFTITKRGIVYPLQAVKQLGDKALQNILEERKAHGRYKSFENFHDRVNKRVVNVGIMINLILAGSFRKFGTKEQIFDELMELRSEPNTIRVLYCKECRHRYPIAKSKKKIEDDGILCPNCGDNDVILWERSIIADKKYRKKKFDKAYIARHVFGYSIQECQLKQYADVIAKQMCKDMELVEVIKEGNSLKIAFEIRKIKKHRCKSGEIMAFIDITDGVYDSSIVLFPRDFENLKSILKESECYVGSLTKNRGKFLFQDRNGNYLRRLKKTYKGK